MSRKFEELNQWMTVHPFGSEDEDMDALLKPYEIMGRVLLEPVIVLDNAFKVLMVNNSGERLLTDDEIELVGTPFRDLVGDVYFDASIKENAVRCLSGEAIKCHDWLNSPGLGRRYLAFNYHPFRGNDDGVIGVVIVAYDFTEQKRAEDNLNQKAYRFRAILDAIIDPIYICSKDLQIEYMNPAMVEMLGEEAVGRRCHEMIYGLKRPCSWCAHDRVMNGEYILFEVTSPKSGNTYHVVNSPLVNPDGSTSKITIYRDISDIRVLETRLHQAQKMEAIGALSGGIAHDFNNILFPLLGYSELLKEMLPKNSPLIEYIDHMLNAGQRAKELVRQILSFSRQNDETIGRIHLHPVVKEALKLLRSTIPSTIDIHQNIDPNCGFIMANPTQVHQIVMNLVTNAFHAMEGMSGKIVVTLRPVTYFKNDDTQGKNLHDSGDGSQTGRDLQRPWGNGKKTDSDQFLPHFSNISPGYYVLLTVGDSGVGIKNEILADVFTPYFTTKENGKGTGLGLAVVNEIVTKAEGHIAIDSEPGKGTRVHICFPVAPPDSEPVQRTVGRTIIKGGNERILLVDDEQAVLSMELRSLERLGYQVSSFSESMVALEAFRQAPHQFDLVITDITMPRIPGDELALELFKIRSDIPVIVLSGYSEKIQAMKTDPRIKGVLMKPAGRLEMAEMIRKVLDECS